MVIGGGVVPRSRVFYVANERVRAATCDLMYVSQAIFNSTRDTVSRETTEAQYVPLTCDWFGYGVRVRWCGRHCFEDTGVRDRGNHRQCAAVDHQILGWLGLIGGIGWRGIGLIHDRFCSSCGQNVLLFISIYLAWRAGCRLIFLDHEINISM